MPVTPSARPSARRRSPWRCPSPASPRARRRHRGADPAGRRDAGWCSSATTGRAPSTCSSRARFGRLGRINMIPDQDARMMEIATNPERLAYYLAIRRGDRRGPRPAGRRHVHLERRAAADRVAAVVRRRGGDQPRDRRAGVAVPGRRTALGPHGDLAERAEARGQRLDREPRARAAGLRRQGARHLPVRWVAARERLHRRREADHARQHRLRLHADRPGPRRPGEGRAGLRDRRREEAVQGAASLRPPHGARRARTRRPQHRRPADDAVAEREERLLPGVVLPRLPGDVAADRRDPAGQAPART